MWKEEIDGFWTLKTCRETFIQFDEQVKWRGELAEYSMTSEEVRISADDDRLEAFVNAVRTSPANSRVLRLHLLVRLTEQENENLAELMSREELLTEAAS